MTSQSEDEFGRVQVLLSSPPAHSSSPASPDGACTDSHFPMCLSLSRNKASSDTAPPASLVAEGAASPARQRAAHQECLPAQGGLGQITSMTQFQQKDKSRGNEGAGMWGWLWMGPSGDTMSGTGCAELWVLSPSTSTSLQGQQPQILPGL